MSPHIGILYEGLLDYELRRADDEPMVFLNVGDQPVLPFSTLDTTHSKQLVELLKKLGDVKGSGASEPQEERDEELEEETEGGEEGEDVEAVAETEPDEEIENADEEDRSEDDTRRIVSEMVQIWAERAVKAAKIVAYPRDDSDARVREAFNREVERAAQRLVARIILPGEWFLVRWGGTRKGAGTFYTRPQLAGPTVRRTLEPLVYETRQSRDREGAEREVRSAKCEVRSSKWREGKGPKNPGTNTLSQGLRPGNGFRFFSGLGTPLPDRGPARKSPLPWAAGSSGRPDALQAGRRQAGRGSLPGTASRATRPPGVRGPPPCPSQTPRGRALHLRRRYRPAGRGAGPDVALGRNDGPEAPLWIPRSQAEVRQLPGGLLVRSLSGLSRHGLGTRRRGQDPQSVRQPLSGVRD